MEMAVKSMEMVIEAMESIKSSGPRNWSTMVAALRIFSGKNADLFRAWASEGLI
jgi:hypothetical protein